MNNFLFALVVFASNVIGSITGFAGTMLAMPFCILLVDIQTAKAVLNVMGLVAGALIVFSDWRHINRKELLRICLYMGIGIVLGLILMRIAEMEVLLTLYGLFILGYALVKLFTKPGPPVKNRWLLTLVLIVSGLIHGLFISGGSLLVVYAISVLPEKSTFRATISGVWVVLNSFLLVQHIVGGFFTKDAILLTLICLIPLILSVQMGTRLHGKVPQKAFQRMTYVLLLISGITILI